MKGQITYSEYLMIGMTIGFLLLVQCAMSQHDYHFKRYSTEDGLSQVSILDLKEDDQGFIWIATRNGLNVFDGFTYKSYFSDPWDSTTIINNTIYAILPDKFNNIWVGTDDGLCRYDRELGVFERYRHDHITEINWQINSLLIDSFNNLWITSNVGVYMLPYGDTKIRIVEYNTTDGEITSKSFNCAISDEIGNIWFGGVMGLFYYDKNDEKLVIKQRYDNQSSPNIDNVRAFELITNNDLWVGSYTLNWHVNLATDEVVVNRTVFEKESDIHNIEVRKIIAFPDNKYLVSSYTGAYIYDPESREFLANIAHDPDDPMSLSDNSIHSMLISSQGDFWVGTYSGGLNHYSPGQNIFKVFRHAQSLNKSINSNVINGFNQDKDGKTYIATSRGGLNIYDPSTKSYNYMFDRVNIRQLTIDSKRQLWIGTFFDGLHKYDLELGGKVRYLDRNNREGNYPGNYATRHTTLIDQNEDIWLAAWHSLYLYNPESDDFERFSFEELSVLDAHAIGHIFLVNDDIWLMTNNGIRVFDIDSKSYIKHYQFVPGDSSSLPNNYTTWGMVDEEGEIWIGTEGGLCLFNEKSESFNTMTKKDGLPSNMVVCIVADREKNIWVSTASGLAVLDPITRKIRSFDMTNNLQSMAFRKGACFACEDGNLLFGGVNGFNLVDPKNLVEEKTKPKVELTGFSLFNNSIVPGEKSVIKKHINFLDTVQLSYVDKVITIEYSAIDYSDPEKNNYLYKLDGFEENWNEVGNVRSATYTNLQPGSYTFRVKASNDSGEFSEEETRLVLIITPPFWMTLGFRVIVLVLVLMTVLMMHRYRVRGLVSQKKILDQRVLNRTRVIEDQKQDLENKNDSLLKAEEEVRTANEQLKVVNDNLELIVEARTQKVRLKNEKIKEVAFLNSHKVRAPLVRILGLINLFKSGELTLDESISINDKIYDSAIELEETTRHINEELNDELNDNDHQG